MTNVSIADFQNEPKKYVKKAMSSKTAINVISEKGGVVLISNEEFLRLTKQSYLSELQESINSIGDESQWISLNGRKLEDTLDD